MAKFSITIECDNAAFGDDSQARNFELGLILHSIAKAVESDRYAGESFVGIRDTNGNSCGNIKRTGKGW